MASPTSLAEQTAESAAPEGQQPYRRSLPTPFLTKTYQIVDDPALDNIISWNEDGSTFIVWRPEELASELLPKVFKHSNFLSFVRQLNTYGFRKIVPDRWEFGNDRFRRGERHLLCDIHRRKVPAAAPPVTAAAVTVIPVEAPHRLFLSANLIEENGRLRSENSMLEKIGLIEENDRLRSENSKLKDEIGEMKGLCDRIMMLMSNYSAGQQVGEVVSAPELEMMSPELGEVVSAPELDLELMSPELASDEVEGPAGARLFGVMIGEKRAREEAEEEREVAVKSEAGSSEASEARSWVL